ncbi:arrestin domain-containing protein 2 isoform X2 [Hyalella azteca]|uniref:Arrestin domain-containing protein 2 isoform X2 n=1 Tax=Hyalella azteca TaxID=294128 RepID=A0A8B7PPT7_HYAAZ|nr:arrestin domain-containing protein 2 isoform X2 [Hyalella azteca]
MGVESFEVVLEPHQEVYFPGQTVQGHVQARASSATWCGAIEFHMIGKAKVKWEDGDDGEGNKKQYKDSEEYFNYKTNLWSPRASEKLSAGNHAWPFNFQLPLNIPSSFEGTAGYIRYSIAAKTYISMGFDKKHKFYISINCPLDLNSSYLAKAPLVIQTTDTSCCLCFSKGPININMRCEHSGAVVGEAYRIRGEVANNGSKEHVTYRVRSHKKTSKSLVVEIQRGPVAPGDSLFFEDEPLVVPPVVPGLQHCRIMDLKYVLKVVASFSCCNDISGEADFVVGTVPFMVEGAMQDLPPSAPYDGSSYNSIDPPPASSTFFVTSMTQDFPATLFTTDTYNQSASTAFDVHESRDDAPSYPSDDPPPYAANDTCLNLEKNSTHPNAPCVPGSDSSSTANSAFVGDGVAALSPGFIPVGNSMDGSGPANQGTLNPFPNKYPPKTARCHFCVNLRKRLDTKSPAPSYLTYKGCF